MRGQDEPWRDLNKILKVDEFCLKGKSHRFRLMSLTQTDSSNGSLPNGHIKSEVVYQCLVCKKYQIDRYVYPKIKRVPV
jgi:hypothetical protein